MSTPADAPFSPMWEQVQTANFVLLFEPDSYGARTVDEIAARAEAAYEAGREWFAESNTLPTITVYLAAWRTDVPTPGWVNLHGTLISTDHDTVCVPVSPEQPAVGLEAAVLEVLVRAAAGAVPVRAIGLLHTLAGLVQIEHRGAAEGKAEDRIAHERFVRGKQAPRLFDAKDARLAEAVDPAELSFLLFLQRTAGRAALARFIRGALTAELEVAAFGAYGRPLEVLQAEWLASLPGRVRGAATGQDVLRRALPLLRPYWLRVVGVLVLMTYDLAFAMAIPLSTKILFDDILGARDFSLLPLWLGGMLVAFGLGAVITYQRMMVAGWIAESILRDLRRALFTHLQALSLRFYAHASTGDLMSRLTNDLDHVEGALSGTLPAFIFSVLSLVAGAIALMLLNWILGLLVLVIGTPIFAVVYIHASERLRQASREQQERFGLMTANLHENLAAQSVVKSFSLEQRAIRLWEQIMGDLFQGSMRLIRIGGILSASSEMIGVGIRLTVMGIGAWMILNDQLTVGGLVAFLGLIGEVLGPVVGISEQYSHLQQASGSLERIDEVLQEVPDIVEDPLAVHLPPLQEQIQLDHVTFCYAHGEAALRDIVLAVPVGARVAIVGPSGAGKSTLAGLLLRHYDPTYGRVLFDGRDIREASLPAVRRQLAVVPQDTFLFDTSVHENILLGREEATLAEVKDAAEAAALHEVIERMEVGYDTLIGERGVRLSGGQRQRLAIARALLRDPRVLILDEATSALDSETEAAILQTLEQAAQGRTLIMITHRLSAAVRCEVIFVLDQGRLVEQGTHQELLRQRGLYWRLFSEQQAGVFDALDLPVDPRRLGRVPLLAQLTPAELALVALRVTVERYPPGTVVVRQGALADKLYVIADGQVEVLVGDPRGGQRQVTILGAHSYFGEIALLGDHTTRRAATVRALSEVELYSVHREDFVALLRTQPLLTQEVERLAERRVEQVRQLLGTTAGPDVATGSAPAAPPPDAALAPPRRVHGTEIPPTLLIVREGAQVGRTNVLDGRVVTLGRATSNDIHLQDNSLSRRHCRFYWADDAYVVEDLGSSNGTFVNGSKVQAATLRSGDLIQVGDQVLEFTLVA